ncbi:small multi-drug export protein [Aquibacillus koreensis]|uniref:Small multi-drug export protein n=1 Tax=Aquibacillus koreensis TaxID=279446 RepID=A0A9X4AIV3_9BACI|nr:small multi-drug export protein [Aquibacillus koreensis]MCT2537849.1 small multi-drug export protein [Aquibacillus koreensis]MDC3421119.1 small multi-drug export protein [Aquibacillus koreensis]
MKLFWGYVLVFILSAVPFFEGYGVIPIAIVAGLGVVPVVLLGLIGNILTVILVIIFIDQINNWRKKRKKEKEQKESKRSTRAEKIWKKYGLPGLAMLGPLVVGSHLTAIASMTFGGTKKKTFLWVSSSIAVWSIVFTILISFGIDILNFEDRGLINYFNTNK